MDLRALRYFLTVAECGSYSRGSELLRISQPAVSRTIRNLEFELGRPVFRRHGHGVTLTEAGNILLERSRQMLRQIEQTKAEIKLGRGGLSGTVSLAVPPAVGQLFVPPLVEHFARDYPNVSLKIVGGFSGHIHEWLVRSQVDVACVHDPRPQKGFLVEPLVLEEVYVVGQKGAFLDTNAVVLADDLTKYPLILPSISHTSRFLLESLVHSRGMALLPKAEVDDHSVTRALLVKGQGFSLLTRSAVEADVQRGTLELRSVDPAIWWTLSLLTVEHKTSPLVAAVIDALKEIIAALVESGELAGRKIWKDSALT